MWVEEVVLDIYALAAELLAARGRAGQVTPASKLDAGFDLPLAYAVGAELLRLRRQGGEQTRGRKIGFTNTALWAAYGLDTPIWAPMYDSTVHPASGNSAALSLAGLVSPRLEPEIVFKLRSALPARADDPEQILQAVEWMALGFEVVHCHYPGWQFQPADAVADFGLHAALVIGEPQSVAGRPAALLARQLREFRLTLLKGGEVVADGEGAAVLGSPALSLGYLSGLLNRQPGAEPLAAGEIVTTGTLTAALPIQAGEMWAAEVTGLDLPRLNLALPLR